MIDLTELLIRKLKGVNRRVFANDPAFISLILQGDSRKFDALVVKLFSKREILAETILDSTFFNELISSEWTSV